MILYESLATETTLIVADVVCIFIKEVEQMNWGFIGWVLGALLTLYVLKFAIMLLRSIFSKESMESMMGAAQDRISDANERLTETIKRKAAQRKAEKQRKKEEENRPIVYIR